MRISPAVSVGQPENIDNYDVYTREDVCIYLTKDFPKDPPNIVIHLKTHKKDPPRLIASRRR
ncbi:MAG: hypothetical protein ACOY46_15605 [Bacillota bacterium]